MPKQTHEPIVYCLGSGQRLSYVGWTNNFSNRLRKHNRDIKGGAVYTRQSDEGKPWKPRFLVYGFPSRSEALSLEKHLHLRRSKVPRSDKGTRNVFGSGPIARRAWSLYWLLQREQFHKRTLTKDMALTIYWHKKSLYKAALQCPRSWPSTVKHTREKPDFWVESKNREAV